jgi:hypothetical protein
MRPGNGAEHMEVRICYDGIVEEALGGPDRRGALRLGMPSDAAHDVPPTSPEKPARPLPPGDPEAALRMLQEWMADESGYDEQTLPALKVALDRNRAPGARKLFDE